MTAEATTLTPMITLPARPTTRGPVRRSLRRTGARVLDVLSKAYAPPAGVPDDEVWRYYQFPVY
jgi:hypothetical protein